jgi:hypothetical protein
LPLRIISPALCRAALEEPRQGEADRDRPPDEQRRLGSRELGYSAEKLLDIAAADRV